MSRRVILAAAALAAALAGAAAPPKEAKSSQADRIFVNGRVWTGEPRGGPAEAVAVRGTRVLAVGTSSEIRRHAAKGTEIVTCAAASCAGSSTATCTCWAEAFRSRS
jgi:hypothetical protein